MGIFGEFAAFQIITAGKIVDSDSYILMVAVLFPLSIATNFI
jgi:hypothetical protein